MSKPEAPLAVTLTVPQLAALVRSAVDAALKLHVTAPAKEVFSLEEVAEFLGRHPKTIKQLIDDKGLPAHYISEREPRFKRTEVLAWLDTLPSKAADKRAA